MSGKGKANIATQGSFALGFPEFSEQQALAHKPDITAAVVRFEEWMEDPNSPVRAVQRVPARAALPSPMPDTVAPVLTKGARAARNPGTLLAPGRIVRAIQSGKNVVIVTPTASGKTLCYNLPVLNLLLRDPGARAMYLFPTKALAEDQLHEFQAAVDAMGADIRAFTYDGDTPQDARKAIRQRANVVLTNPDMLHTGILPHHTKWAKLLRKSALHRDRRAALLSRRLRQPSGESAAPPEAHLRVLRLEAAVHLLLGDHRESARTGRGADRGAVRTGRAQRRARAARSISSSTTRRW